MWDAAGVAMQKGAYSELQVAQELQCCATRQAKAPCPSGAGQLLGWGKSQQSKHLLGCQCCSMLSLQVWRVLLCDCPHRDCLL
jgi:hypothetical protein